jgi:hypothetical protein
MAFVDDYNAWVVGPSADANREGIQAIINRALDWEKRSGATFEGEKTAIVHFSRLADRISSTPYVIKGKTSTPQASAKVLGVVMDSGLRYKQLDTQIFPLTTFRAGLGRAQREVSITTISQAMQWASTSFLRKRFRMSGKA